MIVRLKSPELIADKFSIGLEDGFIKGNHMVSVAPKDTDTSLLSSRYPRYLASDEQYLDEAFNRYVDAGWSPYLHINGSYVLVGMNDYILTTAEGNVVKIVSDLELLSNYEVLEGNPVERRTVNYVN